MKPSKTLRTLRISKRAGTDLEEIGFYTQTMWGEEQRYRYNILIKECFDNLLVTPFSGADYSHTKPGCWRKKVGQHYIFYRPTPASVDIMRILHRKRDIVRHLDDETAEDDIP
jgi:toxin ParE1/3/4